METIEIVDRGRGPQLSTSRITVQDAVPYLQPGSSPEEIQQALPSLSLSEIDVLRHYVEEHHAEVMELDRRIRERAERRRLPDASEEVIRRERQQRLSDARRAIRQAEVPVDHASE